MRTRTKIICTMGPAVSGIEKILQLIDAGMDIARLNFSHGTQEQHLKVIEDLKKAREMRQVPLAIMLDTKGPEIRIGQIAEGLTSVSPKHRLLLVKEPIIGDQSKIQITPDIALDALEVGMMVLFDDGYILSQVIERNSLGVVVEIQNQSILKSHKGVNIPGFDIDLPAMTEQDKSDIIFGCKHGIDIIAASFIRSPEHVLEIKSLLLQQGCQDILVMAKIENSQGVANFDGIVQVADGIMVARGDLGVELPIEQVPSLQKMMIRKCYHAAKPVTTATQMLESMIYNPRPTRAEVSDVANAIFDSTSAVMLSGETAIGQYPIESVKMMKKIIEESEKDFRYREFFEKDAMNGYHDVASSVALASVHTAYIANAQAIFAFTNSGFTARVISKFRPEMPIIALTSKEKTYHQLALNWGVIPVKPTPAKNVEEAFNIVSDFAIEKGFVQYGDLVIVTAGNPFGITGTTNFMIIESIGDVLVRGHYGVGSIVCGKIAFLLSTEEKKTTQYVGRIVVISQCNKSYLPLLEHAIGIVLQNHPEDEKSEKEAVSIAKKLGIPLIVRAEGACLILKEGQVVTLDAVRVVVYTGSSSKL